MTIETILYTTKDGWSVKSFPDMDSEQTLILVFAAPEMITNMAPLEELIRHYPKSKIIGCSSAGEISGTHIFDNSFSVAIAKFEKATLDVVKMKISKTEESFATGKSIAERLNKKDLRGILVLSEGLNVNGSELVKGLNTIEDGKIVITGGLAGDGDRFKNTWTLFQGKIYTDHVVAVGLYGNSLQIGFGSHGGWDVFGPERYITRAQGNVLYELDGQPALTLYKKYLGEQASGLPATGLLFPLAIRENAEDSVHLVRTILGIDEKAQSLIFAGDIPAGYLAQLMRANFDRIIEGASKAGEDARNKMQDSKEPVLAIAISCVGRRLLLGERTEEETESTMEYLPEGSKQVGFYSYGELSPCVMGTCNLHNQTMTLTTIREEL